MMFKILQFVVNMPFVLCGISAAFIAGLVARNRPQMGARGFEILAVFARWFPPLVPAKVRGVTSRMLLSHALLMRGARWEEVRLHAPDSAPTAFAVYFAAENFAQARVTAEDWCRTTEDAIAGREAEMKEFFARYGDDSTLEAKGRIQRAIYQIELDNWNENPRNQRLNQCPSRENTNAQIQPFFDIYDARLALQTVIWMQNRNSSKRHIKTPARQKGAVQLFGLPFFHLNDASLRALGMGPTKLAAIRQSARVD